MTIALRERDSLVKSLQENLNKNNNSSSTSTDAMKRKIEDLKSTVSHHKEELETWRNKFIQAEHSFERAYEQIKIKNAGYVMQIKDLKEKLEGSRAYTGEASQSDMSMKKRSDLIRLENELRQKNEHIESLKESIRGINKGTLKPPSIGNSFSKKNINVPRLFNAPSDLKGKLFEKDKLKSNR
jgi:hypothetical protein